MQYGGIRDKNLFVEVARLYPQNIRSPASSKRGKLDTRDRGYSTHRGKIISAWNEKTTAGNLWMMKDETESSLESYQILSKKPLIDAAIIA